MLRAARLFLFCLLSLTLPVQGIAASLMALHEMAAPSSEALGSPVEACHTMGLVHADAADPVEPGTHAGGDLGKYKACGSCCSAVMASVSLRPTLPSQGRELFLALRLVAMKGFIPDGLERPPRSLS